MILAVLGDVHGALDAMYEAVRLFEEKHSLRVAGVLQVGDMGVFPDPAKLDRATWKHAREDPTELGAADYVSGKKRATHPTWFVRGNHEDFEFLMQRKNRCIDPYGLIHHVFGGPITITSGGEHVRLAGLGGIEERGGGSGDLGTKFGHTRGHSPQRWKYISQRELDELSALREGDVDALLTHDGPMGYFLGWAGIGSETIRGLIQRLQPHYHFFGHYGPDWSRANRVAQIGRTRSILLNQLDVYTLPRRDGGMGILDVSDWSFRHVNPHELQPQLGGGANP